MGADTFSVEHFLNPYGPATGQTISVKYGYRGLKEYLLFKVNGKRFEVTDVQENSVIMKRHVFFFGTLFSKEVSLDNYTSYADTYQKGFHFANLMMQKATCFNTANTSTVARLFAAYPEYALEVMTKMPSLRFVDILNRLQQLHLNGSLRLDVNIDEYISKNEVWKSESLMNPPAAQSISKEVGPLYLFMTELIKRNHCAVVVDLVSLLSKDSSDESSTILFTGLEYQLQLDDREIYINKNNSRYTLKQNYQHRHG